MLMKYAHTNIVARDWKRLARFYQDALQCVPAPPERDLSGEWIDKLTNMENAHCVGAHLRLPGCGPEGPTLEIFQYDDMTDRPDYAVNTPGFTHLAFMVDDVARAAQTCFDHGATPVGELVSQTYIGGRTITVQYLRDPEGNMLELQAWSES
jgi:catechol 2,3-dioxygenase-like lactoylglutathione lyase family enzyme